MNPLTQWALSIAAVAALMAGCFWQGDIHGAHKAELACVNATAAANAEAVTQWKKAADDQLAVDKAARVVDAERAKKAADDAQAVADRFEAMKISIVRMAPVGACKLSPEWKAAFNGAK